MTSVSIEKAITYYRTHYKELNKEFHSFLQIPSVSTSKDHRTDIENAAEFLQEKLSTIGFDPVTIYTTTGHPIVYGEIIQDKENPTILLYGHYDVQPPDPLAMWNTPPFEPHTQGDNLFARGASDMKGQIWALISSLQAIMKTGKPTVNIKFLIEGEEEIGSPSLDTFLDTHRELLECDMVLNIDAGMIAPDKPTIVYGLRGMAYFELRLFGPKADLHSGTFGGVVGNPANILTKVIADLHDQDGRVTLPGFYNQVREISGKEKRELAKLKMDEIFYKEISGVPELTGEKGFTPVERASARPTLDVNGLYAGYIEPGAKTIIPAYAMAKISTRLVPDQDPHAVHNSFISYLQKHVPNSVKWELDFLSGAPAYLNKKHTPGLENFKQALADTWGAAPLMKREGGSIPVATSMKEILGVNSIISGFGLPDDQIHSPNERLHLPTHKSGVQALIRFFLSFGE